MAESKTARASAIKTVKEVRIETTEEAIKAIRDNRAAGLFISDMSRVDKLLQAYDSATADIKALKESAAAQIKELSELKETLKLSDVWNAGKQRVIDDAVELSMTELVKMKDIYFEDGDQT